MFSIGEDNKKEFMKLEERIGSIESEISGIKSEMSRLDGEFSQDVKALRDDIKELRNTMKSFETGNRMNASAVRECIGAEIKEVAKIKGFEGRFKELGSKIDEAMDQIKSSKEDIKRLDKKEIPIQYDEGIQKLRDDLERFKKRALTIDDRVN